MRHLPWLLLYVRLCSCASVSVKRTEFLTPRAPKRIPEEFWSSLGPSMSLISKSIAAAPALRISNTSCKKNSFAIW